jgi:hypothetical protein
MTFHPFVPFTSQILKERNWIFQTLDFFKVLFRIYLYCSLGSVSTLTKWIFFFSKNEFVFKFWHYIFFHHLLWYCDMSSEIIQNVAYENYGDFQHVNFIFSQNFISLFWGLFNDETDLRIRYEKMVGHLQDDPKPTISSAKFSNFIQL